jgi:hypothetical protein
MIRKMSRELRAPTGLLSCRQQKRWQQSLRAGNQNPKQDSANLTRTQTGEQARERETELRLALGRVLTRELSGAMREEQILERKNKTGTCPSGKTKT